MLIFFRKSDGAVVSNSGTSSVMPLGRDDAEEEFTLNVEPRGIVRDAVDFVRVHDQDEMFDAVTPLAAKLLVSAHHIDPVTKAVVIDGPLPLPALTPEQTQFHADRRIIRAFMTAPDSTATAVQRDRFLKAFVRAVAFRIGELEED